MKNIVNFLLLHLESNKNAAANSGRMKYQDYIVFILCGFYCAVAIIFLAFFGMEAMLEGDRLYGGILLGFSFVTLASYSLFWISGNYHLAGHFITLLMAILCLYLFHSGGSENSGVLWYFIFPPLVLFVQGIRTGLIFVVGLMLITLSILYFQLFDFDSLRYSNAFIQRFIAVYFVIAVLSCLFSYFRNIAEKEVEQINKKLEVISNMDSLTNLINRRRMTELLMAEALRFDRFKLTFSLIMLDIDYFKRINDTHGHHYGDYVIQTIGKICAESMRRIDTASRWGGEEFIILLPGTRLEDAAIVAERLRLSIANYNFQLDGLQEKVSASFGVARYREEDDIQGCMKRADQCLYGAKGKGRNCTVTEAEL